MNKDKKHICNYCGKAYTRKIYFDRHVLCCNIKAMALRHTNLDLEEMNDTPSTRELYLMLQELIKKQDMMEKEIKKLKQNSFKDKGSSNLFQRLEEIQITLDFESWRDLLKANETDLQEAWQSGISRGLLSILKRNILSADGEIPIRAFDESPGCFYIYHNKAWNKLANDDFKKLVEKANQLIIQQFKIWSETIKKNGQLKRCPIEDYVFIIFDKNIKINEIKSSLYEAIK